MEAYLFVHFKEKKTPDGEQVYFALSTDGFNWEQVNKGNPVLESHLGEKGVRDHTITRAKNGKFYILATDLSLANCFHTKYKGSWKNISIDGSKHLSMWESEDLVNWSEQRLIKLGDEAFGCLWAPDIIYDPQQDDYVLHWSSSHASNSYGPKGIYYSRTRDFENFTTPKLLCRKEDSGIIDSAIYEENGVFYRFLKSEANPATIILEKGMTLTGNDYVRVGAFDQEMAKLKQGVYEAPTAFRLSNGKWCLMLDFYGVEGEGQGYVPFISDTLDSGQFIRSDESFSFPYGFKHGTVLPITKEEYDRIKRWDQGMKIMDVKETIISLAVGNPLSLPRLVEVELEGGMVESFPVNWEPVEASRLEKPGSFIVEGTVEEDDYPNPLVPNRADPYVLKHTDGYYYFTGSVPEYDRLVLRRSRTIAGLSTAEEIVIWTKHEEGEMGNHIWAPELHRIDEKWYIYFAAGTAENKWAIRPYVLECADADPLTGTWVEKGKIELPVESFSLDMTTFEHKGKRYLAWAQIFEESCLYIALMDKPWSISGEPVKLSSPEYDWEIQMHRVNEGPAVLKRNGRLFMAYSASGTDDRYCMGLLTANDSSDLLDPASWTKSKEPVFVSNEAASEYGPGHNSFTMSEDGSADLLVYHARSYKEIIGDPLNDPNRHARVQRLLWKTDGTPFFGTPGWRLDSGGLTAKAKVTIQ